MIVYINGTAETRNLTFIAESGKDVAETIVKNSGVHDVRVDTKTGFASMSIESYNRFSRVFNELMVGVVHE